MTVERCALSQSARKRILEKSSNFAAKRELIVQDATKTGRILIKTENVCHHVVQNHHHWEKVIELTGNVKEDFKRVVKLLENNLILNKINIHETVQHGQVAITEYRLTINGHKVAALFEHYLDTNETFLKNAYVLTRK